MNRIKCPQDTAVIFNKVVYTNARQRTKPYKQGRSYSKPHFTCSIFLYTEQSNKAGNRNHHHFICIIKEKEEKINSTTQIILKQQYLAKFIYSVPQDYLNYKNHIPYYYTLVGMTCTAKVFYKYMTQFVQC